MPMADRYATFANTGAGRALVTRLGLPNPVPLRRGADDLDGPVLVGGAGRLAAPLAKLVEALGGEVRDGDGGPHAALVFDATGITSSERLDALYAFFHPVARTLRPCGRVLVLGTTPALAATPAEATAQRALEGFVRSVGKEFGRGITAQTVYLAPDATVDDAGATTRLATYLRDRHGRVDVVVHNAGITRDKTLARMAADQWTSVLDVNLRAPERVNEVLLAADLIGDGGRVVAVSSVSGIAGN